jgi:hypothetical protein
MKIVVASPDAACYSDHTGHGASLRGDTDMTVIEMAKASAAVAAQGYVELYLGGEDAYPCGFAWVEVKPKHKGNTKDGKAERVVLKDMGFKLDYTGKTFSLWNPSGLWYQNMDAKYVGAVAAASVLKEAGFDAYACSRLD